MIRNHLEIIAAEHVCRFEVDPATELTILRAIITVSFNVYGYSTLACCCVGKSVLPVRYISNRWV